LVDRSGQKLAGGSRLPVPLRRQFDPMVGKVGVNGLIEIGLGLAMSDEVDAD
jgi:hypothetical protein